MSVKLQETDGGKVLEVQVTDRLTGEDYDHFVPELERLIQQHGKVRVLFEMVDFHGWSAGAGQNATENHLTKPSLYAKNI